MNAPFIRNHHFNFIKIQANAVLSAYRTVSDPKVLDSVRYGAISGVSELFPDITDHRGQMLESISDIRTSEDYHQFVRNLEPYLLAIPSITEQQIRKLFPKSKKLKLPKLADIDFRYTTYLSWIDVSTNKKYIVYPKDGRLSLIHI